MNVLASAWLGWLVFAVVITGMLALDLGVFHRRAHTVRFREAALWSAVWISLALLFNVFVFYRSGGDRALEFFQAWLIEKALSVDNIFVFLLLLSYFGVPTDLQHRVLFWGILGALLTRGLFIFLGAALISLFHWILYIFGAFLVISGAKLLFSKGDEEIHPERNRILRLFRRFVPAVSQYQGPRFTVKRDGRRYATPLLMVLVVVEATDVVFAVDSIPAVFGITTDVFIVYTSNIFAILGLRALFFLVASLVHKLRYLRIGLALVLAFIGVKMLIGGKVHVPEAISLAVVAALIVGAGLLSFIIPEKKDPQAGTQ